MKRDYSISIIHLLLTTFFSMFAIIFYYSNHNIICCLILFLIGFKEFTYYKKNFGYYTNMLSIFSIIWFCSIGLSTLRLHWIQSVWKFETWVGLVLAYIFFVLGFKFRLSKKEKVIDNEIKCNKEISKQSFFCFYSFMALLPIITLILEIFLNGGNIPLLSDDMASYQNFAVGKLHYITVSCCFTLPISYLLIHFYKISKGELLYIVILDLISIIIPIIIVSRQLIIISIVMFSYLLIYYNKKNEKKILIYSLILIAFGWVFIGSFRNQDDNYLTMALRIKNTNISVSTMQAYMYISMNFDNFDYNVGRLKEYQYGINSIFPIFGLTGIKNFFPEQWFLLYDRLGRIINVYNTYPIVMTPYMDGGVPFICLYMFIIGIICRKYEINDKRKLINLLISIILKCCLTFSFFAAWFSRPTWWFYMILLIVVNRVFFNNSVLPKKREEI